MRGSSSLLVPFLSCAAVAVTACAADMGMSAPGDEDGDADEPLPQLPCNGDRALCARSVADVAFAGTHNSFATSDHFTDVFANQYRDIATQLDDGIRAFMLDTFWHKPPFQEARAMLCHRFCTTGGYIDLVPELEDIAEFLADNPREVVLLLIEPHSLSPEQFEESMAEAGLLGQAYAHAAARDEWPTLGQLIDENRRVIVFYENDPTAEVDAPGFYHRLWEHAWETPYSASNVDEMSCDRNRGSDGAALYLVNHFLSDPAGSPGLAREANAWPQLEERVRDCERSQLPNIVAVDYYELDEDEGDDTISVVRAVDYLNGL